MRWRTWTFWLAAFVIACLLTRPVFLFSTSAEHWGVSETFFNIVTTLPYIVGLFAPNQFAFAIEGLHWYFKFSLSSGMAEEALDVAVFLVLSLTFIFVLGRKLDEIREQKGLLTSIAIYVAISLTLDTIVIGGIWYFIF